MKELTASEESILKEVAIMEYKPTFASIVVLNGLQRKGLVDSDFEATEKGRAILREAGQQKLGSRHD